MPITLDGTNGITQAGEFNSDSSFGFKNRIINGAMVIDQRNAGASVTSGFAVDRFNFQENSSSAFTIQRSTTAPAGFTNSVLITVTSAASATAAQINRFFQRIEGFNTADLGFGTANAKTVTLSFWARSSLTGTYCASLLNSAADRSYVAEYTISVANTWEYKTITIAGDTTGTWLTDNGIGIQVIFDFGSGSDYNATAGSWVAAGDWRTTNQVNFANTNGATFYITGVQLEVGSTATSFDYRPYGTEFSLCERYFQKYSGNSVGGSADGGFVAAPIFSALESYTGLTFPQMRTGPSLSYSSLNDFTFYSDATSRTPLTNFVTNGSSNNRMEIYLTWSSNLTAGFSAWVRINKASGFYSLSAEL